MALPTFTLDSAISYIQGKLQDFYNKRYDIDSDYQLARQALQIAYSQGAMIQEATDYLGQMIDLVNQHRDLELRLQPLADAFRVDTGLGILPVVLTAIELAGGVAAVIAVAVSLYVFYDSYQQAKLKRDLIAKGLLPPEAILQPGLAQQIGGAFSNATILIIVGLGAWFLWRANR